MIRNKKLRRIFSLLLVMVLLTGCGSMGTEKTGSADKEAGVETAPVLQYEVPSVSPGILVNQAGYEPSSLKLAIIRGERLPEKYHIVENSTGEVVYTGELEEQGYDNTLGEYISYGDFTGFTETGTYYIEADIVGRSYPFEIKETLYRELMEGALQSLAERREEMTGEDIQDVCIGLSILLLSYELYGPVYDEVTDSTGVPVLIAEVQKYIEWLLAWQDAETGAILVGEKPQAEQTVWLSAVLAKFSYTYQKYDSIYATACLQAADRAWSFLDQEGSVPGELLFYAAAELYRAAGQYQFRRAVTDLGYTLKPDAGNKALVFGTLTYAATKRKVDVDLCAGLTAEIFEEAERIAQRGRTDAFLTGVSPENDGLSGFLWNMVIVASVDYIITNHEYATLIEKYQNFLAGVNQTACCYLSGVDAENMAAAGVGGNCEDTAGYIMSLSEIMSHRQEE